MPQVIVPVTWVGQETVFFCGPAVAQMTLTTLGVGAPGGASSWQEVLWAAVKTETNAVRPTAAGPGSESNPAFPEQRCVKCTDLPWKCWTTTPGTLTRVLNNSQQQATFHVGVHANEADAIDSIVAALDHHIPSIALVFGWVHWIVIEGYAHGDTSVPSCDAAAVDLNFVYIRDPEQDQSIHEVTCEALRDEYLSFVPCGKYKESIVVLGATPAAIPATPPPKRKGREKKKRPLWPLVNEVIVPPPAAGEEAHRAAQRLQLSPRWKPALTGATQQTPLLVQRLDRDDSYYYIVEYRRETTVTCRIIVDAMSGRYREASAIEYAGASLPPYVDPALQLRALDRKSVQLPSLRSRVIRPGTIGDHPVLVWRPCRESKSPFKPFFLRSVGDEFIYFRVDGERFTELTDGPV